MSDSSATKQGATLASDTAGELIARLEAATEGSRELDREIWLFLGKPLKEVEMARQMVAEGRGNEYLPTGDERRLQADCTAQTCYWPVTQSLDAATVVVPAGLCWTLGQNVHHLYWQASVNELGRDGTPVCRGYSGPSNSAPIALCIAALKARSPAVTSPTTDPVSNADET